MSDGPLDKVGEVAARAERSLLQWLFMPVGLAARIVRWLVIVLMVGWACLAIYHSVLPERWLRMGLSLGFLGLSLWVFFIDRRGRNLLIFLLAFLLAMALWSLQTPSHDREWRRDVAVMPRATIEGDRVTLTGVRNFQYRSRDDFTERWETRQVDISHLQAVDFYISYWHEGPVGHTFVSFVFDNAPPVSVSIETRPEVHEGFDPLASLFRQFELIYVVGDERDIVGVRTNHRNEEVFLFRVRASADIARHLFRVYLDRINELADRPEFYHLLSNNCTLNIVRYANVVGRTGRLSFRHFLNGLIDAYLYKAALIDTSLPFEELREKSRINAAAREAADRDDFWRRIRAGLPGMGIPAKEAQP